MTYEYLLVNFINKADHSRNVYVTLASRLAQNGSRSPVPKSLVFVANNRNDEMVIQGDLQKAGLIRDLLRFRDAGEDVRELITFVCTD